MCLNVFSGAGSEVDAEYSSNGISVDVVLKISNFGFGIKFPVE